jgi:hypothetical protein
MRAAPAERLLALLACACACIAGAEPLDTLFHTPQERERLDRLRRGEVVQPQAGSEQARHREVTGYVKRSDGRGTAFIDGVPVPFDPRATPPLKPDDVRAFAGRPSEDLRIERKDTR